NWLTTVWSVRFWNLGFRGGLSSYAVACSSWKPPVLVVPSLRGDAKRPGPCQDAPAAFGQDLADGDEAELAQLSLGDLDEAMKVDPLAVSRADVLHRDANPSLGKHVGLDVEELVIAPDRVDDVAHHHFDLPRRRHEIGVRNPAVGRNSRV